MKKIVLLLTFVVVSFSSCKKQEQGINNHCLFGKWKLYAMYGGCGTDANPNGHIANYDEFLSLHNDFTYTIDNGISIIVDDEYSISNDTLILYNNNSTKKFVYTLNDNELKLYATDYDITTWYSGYLYKRIN